MLNLYTKIIEKKPFIWMIILYFSFEFIFGWFGGTGGYRDGYSSLSFIGIYLLARYFRKYKIKINRPFLLYIGIAILNTIIIVLSLFCLSNKLAYTVHRLFTAYDSPLVLIASVCLFFSFERIKINNTFIIWLASSSLSIYIIHLHPFVFDYIFTPLITRCWHGYVPLCTITLSVLVMCIACILVDKLRVLVVNMFVKLCKYCLL